MPTHREGIFVKALWKEDEPNPSTSTPVVSEIGCTSAPLESMAFFFGAYCKEYNEDLMLCKNSSSDPEKCLKEGRRVTRCGLDLIKKLKLSCNKVWEDHWKCLDMNNHDFYRCRTEEKVFNSCVFDKLGLKKIIPETVEGEEQIHEKTNPLFK